MFINKRKHIHCMVKELRKPFNIRFTDSELERIEAVAKASGESVSGYIRRQILTIVNEEESQND